MTAFVLNPPPAETGREICTAMVGPLLIGIDIDRVREVFSHNRYTPVPRTGRCVSGLINLRGQIITAIDLRCCFEVDNGPHDENIHIVVSYRGEPVSLIVDDVLDVMTVSEDTFEPHPETVDAATRQLLRGAYKLADDLLLPLDTDMIIASASIARKGSEE